MKLYGRDWPAGLTRLDIELIAYRDKFSEETGGLGPAEHFKNVYRLIWPELATHDWWERRAEAWCNNSYLGLTGCGSSGKTFDTSAFALMDWLADPMNTTVILTSTSVPSLRARIWGDIKKLYKMPFTRKQPLPGHLVDSMPALLTEKRDSKNGIFGIAVEKGKIDKAAANIQGRHNKRVIVVIDEMPAVPEAIMTAVDNLSIGAEHFRLIGIGNAADKFDQHGRFCEPKAGWASVDEDQESWETKRGVCLHFDALYSPNVVAGSTVVPGLATQKDIDSMRNAEGEDSPKWWMYIRGFWPPEGICKTVFSHSIAERCKGTHFWTGPTTDIASLDPAFEGGDRCTLRFGKYGRIEDDRFGLQLEGSTNITVNIRDPEPIHHQIARRIKEECETRGILPENFALDTTGEGGGLASILKVNWSYKINEVEFGGSPSDLPTNQADPRPAKEKYDRRVTELWYESREFANAGQIQGLDDDTAQELCSRLYDLKSNKISVETKKEMKVRFGRSPDLADAFVVMVELVRRKGGIPGGKADTKQAEDWIEQCKKHDVASDPSNYLVEVY